MGLIGTSIYIEKGRLALLRRAIKLLDIPEQELLSMLLVKSRRLFGNDAVIKRRVRYQRGCDGSEFRIEHIIMYDSDYEFATSRRYLFKISVSYILRLAIDSFLDTIIDEWLHNPDEASAERRKCTTNFHFCHFNIDHSINDSAELWRIPWPIE